MKKNITIMLIVLLLFFQWGQSLTYANEQNDIEEKAKEAGGNEVDNKSEVDVHEQIDNDRDLTNSNTSEFEIQPNSAGVTIVKYLGAGGSVVVPETIEGKPVTIIGNLAFYESNLTEIVIPESVITIGDWAFAKTQLSTIVIPDSVEDIGRWTFQNSKLTSVTISKNLTTIGAQAFYGNQLVHVDIPDGVTAIDYQAFFGNRLTTVNIPDSVTIIGAQAFTNNRITNIKIPNSVTSIGDEAFGYNQLINVELPNSITSIGNYVFDSNRLTTVNIPNSVTSIGIGAFQANYLTNVELSTSLLSIGNLAFFGNKLKTIVVPNNVISIGDWGFGQNQLTSIQLPNSLLSIGNLAFYDNQLSTVSFPNSLTSIGDRAFEYNRLQWVQFNSPLMLGVNAFNSQGSTFDGWYQDLSWVTKWDVNVTQPLRIYAKGNVQQYTVTFETNSDGTTIEEQKVLSGEKVVEPDVPVKAGFTFDGWYKDEELNKPWNFNTDVITENKILYAKWLKNSHTVTFHSDTDITTVEVPEGALLSKPSIPIKEGHKFIGWFNEERTTEWNFDTFRVTFDIDLYAVWLKNVYGVRFEAGNSTTPIIIVAEYGDKLEEPEPPILAGQIFAGWYKNPALTKLWDFATDVVTEHTTLYAKWDIVQQQYVVQFESNGGSPLPSQTINSYMTATKPENPVKVGYTFAGWYKDKKFTTLWEFEIDKVTENITLYAKWDLVQQYELKFESNGGSSVPSQTFTSPMKATKPINPTKTGHLFVDWYKDAELHSLWNFEIDRVTEDTTLYAKWEKVITQYTVDFETNGGSTVVSQKVTEDTLAIKPADPTKAGYEFAGWYTDAVFSTPWNFTTDKVTENTTLYAKWEKVITQY
ncbi:InlB B-repeat-containing protein, partial [Lysinibacillus sp. A4]